MAKLLRIWLPLLLVFISGKIWAETGTITFGSNNTKINAASVTANDDLDNSWTITTVGTTSFTGNAGYYQVGSSGNPATSITFTTTLSEDVNITAFSAKFGGFNGTAGTITLKVGDTTVATGSLNASNDVTVASTTTTTGKVLTITVTGISKGVKCYNISYTYSGGTPTVATPTFSPAAGEVARGTVVTFNCVTPDVTYYYTTDGTTPTTSSASATSYTVNDDVTLKVMATKADMGNSSVATAAYTVAKNNPNLAFSQTSVTANIGETFTPPTLSWAQGYDGTITYSSSNSAITVDAATGEVSFGNEAIDKTTTITATATATDNFYSGSASYTLTVVDPNAIQGNLNNNTFGTTYSGSITPIASFSSVTGNIGGVTVTYSKGAASYAYINNSQIRLYAGTQLSFTAPNGYAITSLVFNTSLTGCSANVGSISGATWTSPSNEDVSEVTITKSGSSLTLTTVTIHLEALSSSIAAPTITPTSGTYAAPQTVTITNNADGATVYYTTDGTTPTAQSTAYHQAFTLSKNGTYTVKAIAINGNQHSRVATQTITISISIDAPVFTETSGTTFAEPYTIHLTAADGCTIYYATGTESPIDNTGNLSSAAIMYNANTGIANLSKAVTITAVAVDAYGNASNTATASYNYTGTVETPYYENFDQGLGNFTVETTGTNPPEWEFRTSTGNYGTRKYAYVNGSKKSGTTRLVSPYIDLADESISTASLNFIHAGRYFEGYDHTNYITAEETASGYAPTHAQLFVREEGGEWQQLTIPNWFTQAPTGASEIYTRFNSGDIPLTDYLGKKIQVSFLYTADTESTGTWNVLKFALTTTNVEIVNMKTDGYVTYVVKNDIDWTQTKAQYPDVHGYKVTEFSKESASFVEFGVGDNEVLIPAETPIIIKGKQGENRLVIAKSDDVIAKPKNNLLRPSYGDVTVAAGQHLLVFQKDKDWSADNPYEKYGFYKLTAGRLIPERKAYLNAIDVTEELTQRTNIARGIYRLGDLGRLSGVILGDVNSDGTVDVNDVMGIVSDICGEQPERYVPEAADVNGDEEVDVNDVMNAVDIVTKQVKAQEEQAQ